MQVRKASMGSSVLIGAAVVGLGLSWMWKKNQENQNEALFPTALDVNSYRRAKLVSSRQVGGGSKVLKFRYENGPGIAPLKPFCHLSIRGKTMDVPPEYPFGLKVERPYTPISASKTDFEILVKHYPKDESEPQTQQTVLQDNKAITKGITSRFLLHLEPGAVIEVKGPTPTFNDDIMKDALASRKFVGFVCGGSGITPAIQMLSRLGPSDTSRRFSVLWSNRNAEQMFFKKDLENMTKSMKNVNIRYTLTRIPPPGWQHDTGRVSKELLRVRLPPPSPECLIIVCGPDSFVQAISGGKRGPDGKWIGEIGGFLKELDYNNDHVLRL